MDLIVTSLERRPAILLNTATGGGHWLTLFLVGRKANRDSIGARITVTTPAGRALHEWVSQSVGFLSSSDPRVHIGLGTETRAASIEVRWPGGGTITLKDVAADQFLTIREPI